MERGRHWLNTSVHCALFDVYGAAISMKLPTLLNYELKHS